MPVLRGLDFSCSPDSISLFLTSLRPLLLGLCGEFSLVLNGLGEFFAKLKGIGLLIFDVWNKSYRIGLKKPVFIELDTRWYDTDDCPIGPSNKNFLVCLNSGEIKAHFVRKGFSSGSLSITWSTT